MGVGCVASDAMSKTVPSLLVAALVVLAGCSGGVAGPELSTGGSEGGAGDSGTVQFYVSDERNAIDQFEHLNVTVTSVGFARAGGDAGDANETAAPSGNESAAGEVEFESESEGGLAVALADRGGFVPGENATVRVTHDGEPAPNVTAAVETGDRELTVRTGANGTATVAVPADAEDFEVEAETAENSTYGESEVELSVEVETDDDDDDDDGNESEAGWVERDVDERTVDLTELQGANATALGNISVPAGEYETVFVHVGEVDGTLESGEGVNVKLPSQKLKLNEGFTVDDQSDVAFVFDITVFEAGNSGKYILKPVASESGTDVPIVDVDEKRGGEADGELDVSVAGSVTAGGNATVEVTQDGEPVENATVEVTGDVTVTTDADGTATVAVPAAADEFEVEAEYEGDGDSESEGELEVDLGESESDDEREADGGEADSETPDGDAGLAVVYEGAFAANESVTLTVTDGDGEPVEDATVELDGETVGETDADGELSVELPADVSMASELTVTADGESVTVDVSTVAAAE